MVDKIAGYLEVGTNGKGEVVINYDSKTFDLDENGLGHIVFSPNQALNLAAILEGRATEAQREMDAMAIEKAELYWERAATALYLEMMNTQVDDPEDYRADRILPYLARAIVALRRPKTIGDLLGWETDTLKWIGLEHLVDRLLPDEFADVFDWEDLLLVPERASFDGKDIAQFIHDYLEHEKWETDKQWETDGNEATGK